MRLLCSRMCEPSTAARGVESWIASSAATLVSRLATPDDDAGPTIPGTCGRTSAESSTSPMLPWPSSRTSEGTSARDSEKFWKTSRPSGSMRNGSFSPRPKSVPLTDGSECSSSRGGATAFTGWPTPDAMTGHRAGLANDPDHWERRRAEKAEQGINLHRYLNVEAAAWTTPSARDHKDTPGMETTRSDGRTRLDQLPRQAFRHARETQTDGDDGSTPSRVLNPRFVEALMGLPIGWTDSALSETEWSRYRQRLRSAYSQLVQACEEVQP